ncbi:ankyrin repeat protein [Acanthamoeba polyphaga moumouvirus]|uniref:Ankyrin repeat protein n=1 Tax=Acanthamoeba polyphaga moumouvirus TaxID=1269028 RepID=L7RCF1_9VIRU|nr:ankyrin repeat protein [Acanthamoeba polyphaga moumouvirus]AGC01967.1 ankyrin repeat protein [Acanthamoeba polyphaga moumouvirus]
MSTNSFYKIERKVSDNDTHTHYQFKTDLNTLKLNNGFYTNTKPVSIDSPIINTAIKTANISYLERKLNKILEDFEREKIEPNVVINELSHNSLYLKVTNEDECHNGFQYKDGLNILQEEFNDDPKVSCVPGRLYFTEPKYICKYLGFGIYLREVYLPKDNPDFKMIKDPEGDKYGANMIILGKRRDLRDPETWKYMASIGVDIHGENGYAFIWACQKGYLKVVKYLVKNGANIHAFHNYAFECASEEGHLEIVEYLVKNGVNIHTNNDIALRWASGKGHFEIVKFLVENGTNIHAENNCALRWASDDGHLEIVKYLVEKGADIHANNNYALRWASQNGHLEVVKYLKSLS